MWVVYPVQHFVTYRSLEASASFFSFTAPFRTSADLCLSTPPILAVQPVPCKGHCRDLLETDGRVPRPLDSIFMFIFMGRLLLLLKISCAILEVGEVERKSCSSFSDKSAPSPGGLTCCGRERGLSVPVWGRPHRRVPAQALPASMEEKRAAPPTHLRNCLGVAWHVSIPGRGAQKVRTSVSVGPHDVMCPKTPPAQILNLEGKLRRRVPTGSRSGCGRAPKPGFPEWSD